MNGDSQRLIGEIAQRLMARVDEFELPDGAEKPRIATVAVVCDVVYHSSEGFESIELVESNEPRSWVIAGLLERVEQNLDESATSNAEEEA